jgi:3-deoxy-manno-octulosonate cytidylyltransferase (CMP-KDO synthetase)
LLRGARGEARKGGAVVNPVAVIPARYGSSRLPGKPLLDLCGKPIIQRVYERVKEAGIFSRVLVATDSEEIARRVEAFGGESMLTSPDHRSGTERIAEVAGRIDGDWIVNVQGDEPFIHPSMLADLWESFRGERTAAVGTLCHRISDPREFRNRNVVKVVTDTRGRALYFSRSAIPYGEADSGVPEIDGPGALWYKHVGIYMYRRSFLLGYPMLGRSPLEDAEGLEQLRILEHGYEIRVYPTERETLGIDTVEDLEEARRRCMAEAGELP